MASGIVAERRRAPSGDVKAALLAALFSAIPHRPLMRYGEHSCKKLKKAPKGEPMAGIVSCTDEFEEYLRDESRSVGSAESIVFPESEADVRDALHALHATGVPVTVQGARSGLAAGAVPHGGCVLNTSRMNRVLGMRPRLRRPLLCARATGSFAHGAARHAAEGEFRHGGLE